MPQDKQGLYLFTNSLSTDEAAGEVDRFVELVKMNRKGFERRWYDNNFFDDGYHFRYVSRTTGRIVDQNEKNLAFAPNRAIPKASRQIRGIANLLMQLDPNPVIYPKYVPASSFPPITDPQTGQMIPNPLYAKAVEQAKTQAQRQGSWVQNQWETQYLKDKLVEMVILAAKHGVSYIQIWPDHQQEKIRSKVWDAFDIWIMGDMENLEEEPMIVKTSGQLISQIKSNPLFDEDQKLKISPDNKFATSEIKQAYMQSRFGSGVPTDSVAKLQLKEAFIKEHLTDENAVKVARDLGESFKSLNEGDTVIRQIFTAGGVWLYDKYTTLTKYPFVDYRFEPGPIYQVPLIERFIPANKSLDIIMSRLERYSNTMGVGVLAKRKGENYTINNSSSAQEVEYETTPPVQMPLQGMPNSFFNLIGLLEKHIDEQGASLSTLNQIPSGVRSGDAIEQLKSTEYANLKIPTNQLINTVTRITERLLDVAANHFVKPQTVFYLDKGEPDYFEVIGEIGIEARKEAKITSEFNGVVINKDTRVKIEVESGMGFTEAGKKQTMKSIIEFMIPLMERGLLTQEAVKVVVQKFFDIYKFGSTQEFMDALDKGTSAAPLTEDQLTQMKIAMLQAMKDAGVVGAEADVKLVDSTKVGTLETLKDTGMLDKKDEPKDEEVAPINYKDVPEDVKRQMEERAGFIPSEDVSPQTIDQFTKLKGVMDGNTIRMQQNMDRSNKTKGEKNETINNS